MTDEKSIAKAAEATAALAQAVPVYQDVVQPAAREIGTVAGRTVRALLGPVRGLVWGVEQIEQLVETRVGQLLERVPQDQRQTPSPTIAVPTMQALTYTAQEEELRELYLRLLASAIDKRVAASAHPAFVEIIKQMTPDEARLFRYAYSRKEAIPIVTLHASSRDGDGRWMHLELFGVAGWDANCVAPINIAEYLVNLSRLGLVEIPQMVWLSDASEYQVVFEHEIYKSSWGAIVESGSIPEIEKQVCRLTPFGRQFGGICLGQRTPS